MHLLEFVMFQVVGFFVRLLPLRLVGALGAALGSAVFRWTNFRKRVTMDNLRRAFPEESEEKLEEIARGAFESVGASLLEFMWTPRLTAELLREYVRIPDVELLHTVRKRGKGVVLLGAHFGNWELMAESLGVHIGESIHIIVKPQSNRYVDRVINEWRVRLGNQIVPMGRAVREVLGTLHSGGFVGILADQSAPRESLSVTFFGRQVPTFEGPAMFCLKTGASMVLCTVLRRVNRTYEVQLQEIPTGDLKNSAPESIKELTQRHVSATEQMIRVHPEQWLWMHKRWKHLADDSAGG